jgi:four helix bundle protein
MPSPSLGHESLHAYKVAIQFIAVSAKLPFPVGAGALTSQLRRAELSIALNIAEGYSRRSARERNRFYEISRGSAHECSAILDASVASGFLEDSMVVEGKELLHRVVSMLVGLGR